MNQKQVRADIMNGLNYLESVRSYVGDARLSKEFPDQENFGPPFDADMGKIEDELHEALMSLYKGLKELYSDFALANSIDGEIPIWKETAEK